MVFLKVFLVFLPWSLRRWLLVRIFKFKIHSSARIGFSYVYPLYLEMGKEAKIDHLTVAIHLDKLIIKYRAKIGRGNWITGWSTNQINTNFSHQKDRKSELTLGSHSAITKNHHIDCTHSINIGQFTTIAGYRSQFLTHSIDLYESRQHSLPINIGDYCFVGSNVLVLGGSNLPSFSVLGAKSLLNKNFLKERMLYAGTPAIAIKEISDNAKYFVRREGFVK